MSHDAEDRLTEDARWRARARNVIPGCVYGHQNVSFLPRGYPPASMSRGDGAHVWDADGNEYIDLMCSYGPVLLGHRHPKVDEARLPGRPHWPIVRTGRRPGNRRIG